MCKWKWCLPKDKWRRVGLHKHCFHLHILLHIFHLLPSPLWFLLYLRSAMTIINNSQLLTDFCGHFSKHFGLNWPCYFCCNLFLWYRFVKSRSSLRKMVKEQWKSKHNDALYSIIYIQLHWPWTHNEAFFHFNPKVLGLGR